MDNLTYQSGFANEFASEAVPGALPLGRNSPQRAPFSLYAELLSGTAFTAPRAENRRTWLYRRQPSVAASKFVPYEHKFWSTGRQATAPIPPEPMRWAPFDIPEGAADFIDGLRTVASNGDVESQTGVAVHVYVCNRSMTDRALVNSDGEMLVSLAKLSWIEDVNLRPARSGVDDAAGVDGDGRAGLPRKDAAQFGNHTRLLRGRPGA